jgi:hypothetical protein
MSKLLYLVALPASTQALPITLPDTTSHYDINIIRQCPAMSVSRTTGGPSPADWERVRPLIKHLYVEEDRTLSDVMSIMARDHGHKATYGMTLWLSFPHCFKSDTFQAQNVQVQVHQVGV